MELRKLKDVRGAKTIAVLTLFVVIGMGVFSFTVPPAEARFVFVPVNAAFEGDAITSLILSFQAQDSTYFSKTLYPDEFVSGVSVPIGSKLVTLTVYFNVSASYYTSSPMDNTWVSIVLKSPSGITAFESDVRIDAAYPHDVYGAGMGSGYNPDAVFYKCARSVIVQQTLTQGAWTLEIEVYLT